MSWHRSLHGAARASQLLSVLLVTFIALQSHAFSLSSRRPFSANTPKFNRVHVVNNKPHDAYITHLMMVRGGDEDESSSEEYSDSDSEEIIEPEPITKPSEREIEIAQRQIALASQSRNFGIATALWSSLFFDSILNKAKRQFLFPVVEGGVNLIPTALLASGYALASCVSFVLWRDFDVRSEMEDETDDGDDVKKGDWFLSLSCFTGKGDNKQFVSQTRTRLYFYLALFGLVNLGAHAGYYFSDAAPFLGLSAAAINFHNTLAVANALLKEASASDLVSTIFNGPLSLITGGEDSKGSVDTLALLFRLGAIAFLARCISVGRDVISLAQVLLTSGDPSSVLNNARELSLGIAALGRLTLAAGVSQVFFSSRTKSLSEKMRNHPFFAVLSGACSLLCFGVGGALLFPSFKSGIQSASLLSKAFPLDGLMLSLMGLVLGYNSAMGGIAALKELRN